MYSTFSILFFLRNRGNKSTNLPTIYARITVDQRRSEFSTQHTTAQKWNSKLGKIPGSSAEGKMINRHLDDIRTRIYEIHDMLVREGKPISATILKDLYLGKDVEKKMLIAIFTEHNDKMRSLVGKGYSKGTLTRYEACKKHLASYILFSIKKKDIPVREVDYQFISGFEHYMKSEKECSHNTTTKYIVNFKKIMRIAYANQWVDRDPFFHWKSNWRTKEREFLTASELNIMAAKEFDIDRLDLVRDIFLFCCFTGLAYADVNRLSKDDIVMGLNGERWIKIKRKKTNTLSSIPILPTAEGILAKYDNHPDVVTGKTLLPVFSNQKSNAYLKEIAAVCGIKKHLTTHLARHTFATTVTLSRGVPIETVSKMLGHTSLKTTQLYAKVLDTKISTDMDILKQKEPILKGR